MSAGKQVQVLRPKTPMDRRLARLEQIRVWDYVGQTVADDADAIEQLKAMAVEAYAMFAADDATPAFKLKVLQVSSELLVKAHQIRKETFHDRTIPALKSVEVRDAMRHLPGEDEVPAKQGDELAAFRDAVRGDLARLCQTRLLGIVEAEVVDG